MGFHDNAVIHWPFLNSPESLEIRAKHGLFDKASEAHTNSRGVSPGAPSNSVGSVWSVASFPASPPQLDSASITSSLVGPGTPRASKQRGSTVSISFIDCSTDHPLSGDSAVLETAAGPRSTRRSAMAKPQNTQTNADHEQIPLPEQELREEFEMKLYATHEKVLIGRPKRRTYRQNSEFLRMYAAERQMMLKGKIQFIPTQSILPPRTDTITPEPSETLLGIHCGWQRTRARRSWEELTAEDFF